MRAFALTFGVWLALPAPVRALDLSIEAPKEAVVGESAQLAIRVANDGTETHPGFHLEHDWGDFAVWISKDREEPWLFVSEAVSSGWRKERARDEPIPLEPGEVREARVSLSWDVVRKAYALASPGRHVVEVRTEFAGSESIEIEVVAPEGEAAEALRFAQEAGIRELLSEDAADVVAGTDARVAKLEEFDERFGDTPHGAGVKRALRALGRGPILQSFPEVVQFEPCPVGEFREWRVLLKSNGTRPVRLVKVASPAVPFEAEDLPGPATLQPGWMSEFVLRYRPVDPSAASGEIVFHGDGEILLVVRIVVGRR